MIVSKITKFYQRWRSARSDHSAVAPLNELTGRPVRPRIKTYSTESGYVYQYVYRGSRITESAQEYVFSASARPGRWDALTVRLGDAVITKWQHRNSRVLTSTQKYAIAKMAMFQLLDEAGELPARLEVSPDLAAVERYLEDLQIA